MLASLAPSARPQASLATPTGDANRQSRGSRLVAAVNGGNADGTGHPAFSGQATHARLSTYLPPKPLPFQGVAEGGGGGGGLSPTLQQTLLQLLHTCTQDPDEIEIFKRHLRAAAAFTAPHTTSGLYCDDPVQYGRLAVVAASFAEASERVCMQKKELCNAIMEADAMVQQKRAERAQLNRQKQAQWHAERTGAKPAPQPPQQAQQYQADVQAQQQLQSKQNDQLRIGRQGQLDRQQDAPPPQHQCAQQVSGAQLPPTGLQPPPQHQQAQQAAEAQLPPLQLQRPPPQHQQQQQVSGAQLPPTGLQPPPQHQQAQQAAEAQLPPLQLQRPPPQQQLQHPSQPWGEAPQQQPPQQVYMEQLQGEQGLFGPAPPDMPLAPPPLHSVSAKRGQTCSCCGITPELGLPGHKRQTCTAPGGGRSTECTYPKWCEGLGSGRWDQRAPRYATPLVTEEKCECPMHCSKQRRQAQHGFKGPDWAQAMAEQRPEDWVRHDQDQPH